MSDGSDLGSSPASLRVVPTTLREANAFVAQHHRHHQPTRGCIFVLAVADGPYTIEDPIVGSLTLPGGTVRGVAIIGRPVARRLHNGFTAEVTRVCTDGSRNACSMLYGAAWRAARAIGYRRLVTYTLPEEGGASLRAAGWRCIGEAGGGTWGRADRPRVDLHPTQVKLRWEAA